MVVTVDIIVSMGWVCCSMVVTMCLLLISSYLWDWNLYVGCVLPFNNIASALLLERNYFKDPPDGCHLMWVLSLVIIYVHERVYIIKSSCIFHI